MDWIKKRKREKEEKWIKEFTEYHFSNIKYNILKTREQTERKQKTILSVTHQSHWNTENDLITIEVYKVYDPIYIMKLSAKLMGDGKLLIIDIYANEKKEGKKIYRKGIGSALLRSLEEAALDNGINEIYAIFDTDNKENVDKLERFYRKNGYLVNVCKDNKEIAIKNIH